MTLLPYQLRNKDFRFIKIKQQDKRPFEKDWQKTNNYAFNDVEFISWLSIGGNYGVVCGRGYLVVIDCDEEEIAEIVEQFLPKTFAVRTGSGGKHYYFIIRDMNKTIILKKQLDNKEEKHCGEIRCTNSQVIGPNSIHPNGNRYEIYRDNKIAEVHKATIDEIFRDYIERGIDRDRPPKHDSDDYESIDIKRIIDLSNFKRIGSEYQGSHPIHGSKTGHNLCVNTDKNLWKCFRCNSGGGPVSLIAVLNGIVRCSAVKTGYMTPAIFDDVKKLAKEKYGIILKEVVK